MIDALVSGRMYGQAQKRDGHADTHYVTCKLKVINQDGDMIFCNVISFDAQVQDELLALGDGDAVALSGALTAKVWEDKQGKIRPAIDLNAYRILSAYHAQMNLDALQNEQN